MFLGAAAAYKKVVLHVDLRSGCAGIWAPGGSGQVSECQNPSPGAEIHAQEATWLTWNVFFIGKSCFALDTLGGHPVLRPRLENPRFPRTAQRYLGDPGPPFHADLGWFLGPGRNQKACLPIASGRQLRAAPEQPVWFLGAGCGPRWCPWRLI